MTIRISLITVCYNSAKTIEKTIESVAAQKGAEIEYVVVDGASTDGTQDFIRNYKQTVTHFLSEPDRGLYDAMNKGIALATCDYVGIINSDDVFCSSDVIQRIADFHAKNPGVASLGNILQHNGDGKIVRRYSAKSWSPSRLKIGFMPPHPAIFFPRAWFQEFGNYRLDFKIGADYELITRYFLKHKLPYKYSNITTTSMLQGGLSTAGPQIYWFVTKEIERALDLNDVSYWRTLVRLRWIWKLGGYLKLDRISETKSTLGGR